MVNQMINFDIDTDRAYDLMKVAYNLQYFYGNVFFRKSSGHNWHVKCYMPQKISPEVEWAIRSFFGDDIIRLRYDYLPKLKEKPKRVLWTGKGKNHSSKWMNKLEHIPRPFKSSKIPFRRRM